MKHKTSLLARSVALLTSTIALTQIQPAAEAKISPRISAPSRIATAPKGVPGRTSENQVSKENSLPQPLWDEARTQRNKKIAILWVLAVGTVSTGLGILTYKEGRQEERRRGGY